jgi:4-hydroxy-tetrahydrodipicolinate reductase
MEPITVLVNGALGKMGREVVAAISRDPALELIGAVDIKATQDQITLADGSKKVPLSTSLNSLLESRRPKVLLDFTIAEAAMEAARMALKRGVNVVIGTSGLTEDELKEIDQLSRANKVGAIVAPNFTVGIAVLLNAAKDAAKLFDYVDIIEMHHNEKADAPSGTALATAKAIVQARGRPFLFSKTKKETLSGTRGGEIDGVAIHSVRLPGFVASQEVVFGGQGQTLRIRHDTIGRECYMPGVILAIKEVVKKRGLVYGLDTVLSLKGE